MPYDDNRREWDDFWSHLASNPPHDRQASDVTGEVASDIEFDTSGNGVRQAGATDALWEGLMHEIEHGGTATMDAFLQGNTHQAGGGHYESVRGLTDKSRQAKALSLESPAGTRVEFAGNLGAIMAYDNPPAPGAQGTIVKVKAGGLTTHYQGRIFVKWDRGGTVGIAPQHLRLASANRRRVASLGDLSGLFGKVSNDTLVHKSTRDLWSLRKDGDEFVIERMFDGDGSPLKV